MKGFDEYTPKHAAHLLKVRMRSRGLSLMAACAEFGWPYRRVYDALRYNGLLVDVLAVKYERTDGLKQAVAQ